MPGNERPLHPDRKAHEQLCERISVNLHQPSIRENHIRHLAMTLGLDGDAALIEDVISSITNHARQNPLLAPRIHEKSAYLVSTYPKRFRVFQANFFPFAEPSKLTQDEWYGHLAAHYGLGANGRWTTRVEKGLGVARIWRVPSGIRLLFVNVIVNGKLDDDTGITIGKTQVIKRNVLVKPEGIEIRADRNFAKRVINSLQSAFSGLNTAQRPIIPESPLCVGNRSRLFSMLDHISRDPNSGVGRLLQMNADDSKRFLGHKGAGAQDDRYEPEERPLRDLRQLVTMRHLIETLDLEETDFEYLERLLASNLRSAVVEFDYRHPDGYWEEFITVSVTPESLQVDGPMSESAIGFMWGALKDARRHSNPTNNGAAIRPGHN